jgi:hypothetical protein
MKRFAFLLGRRLKKSENVSRQAPADMTDHWGKEASMV